MCFGKVEVVEASKGDTIGGLLMWEAFGGMCLNELQTRTTSPFTGEGTTSLLESTNELYAVWQKRLEACVCLGPVRMPN